MKPTKWVVAILTTLICACTTKSDPRVDGDSTLGGAGGGGATTTSSTGGQDVPAGGGGSGAGGSGVGGSGGYDPRLDQFAAEAAQGICDNLFRCCATADVAAYLGGWAGSDTALEDAGFPALAPPNVTIGTSAECQGLVAQMIAVAPFGDWIEAAKAGTVTFDGAAFDTCLTTLATAACGEPLRAALFDSACLSFTAPINPDRRSIFGGVATSGPCTPIRDGVGARFFGTCDRQTTFCCYTKAGSSGCAYPFDAEGNPRTGECISAGAPGDPCSLTLDAVQLCRGDSVCGSSSGTCVAVGTAPLGPGATCYDHAEYVSLGECSGAYFCDDDGFCAALKPHGESCWFDFECVGGDCDANWQCTVSTYCGGS